ncbi:MAG: transcription termination factor NusA [Clostridia bacterium]
MINEEFFQAVKMLETEKGIPAEYLYDKIKTAIIVAIRHDYNGKDIVFCDINPDQNELKVYVRKNVVAEIEDEDTDLTVDAAKQYKRDAVVGDFVDIPLETHDLGRIAAQTAKHVIRQGIREAERGSIMQEFRSKQQEIVTARIERIDPITGNASLAMDNFQATLVKNEQVPGEELHEGDLIKVYIVEVRDSDRGPRVMISRTHPGMIRRLFENEVPEIYDGTVEIKSVAREAGMRSKIAVCSRDENVDPIGSCIGPHGSRVNAVVEALGGEKIDVVKYDEDPATYVASALAPATVLGVDVEEGESGTVCHVTVPDGQLSLAIGNKGQNARLAAKLTGCKIDISPESGFYEGPSAE